MKKIVFLILLFTTIGFAQKNKQNFITIEGEVTGFNEGDKISVFDQCNNVSLGAGVVKNNKFKIYTQKINDGTLIYISIGEDTFWSNKFLFFGEPNTVITVKGDKNDVENFQIVDANHKNQYRDFVNLTQKEDKKIDAIYLEVEALKNNGNYDSIVRKKYRGPNGIVDKIEAEKWQKQKEYFFKNSNAIFAQKHLLWGYISFFTNSELSKLYQSLSQENKHKKYGKLIQTYLKNKPLVPGNLYYNISGEDENGKKYNLSEVIKDKYTLISFTTPYCPHRVDSITDLLKLEHAFSQNLKIITYYIDSVKSEWIDFNKEKKIDWLCLWDNDMRFSDAVTKYHVNGTPTFYLFDKKGKMVKLFDGYDEAVFYKEVAQILK